MFSGMAGELEKLQADSTEIFYSGRYPIHRRRLSAKRVGTARCQLRPRQGRFRFRYRKERQPVQQERR